MAAFQTVLAVRSSDRPKAKTSRQVPAAAFHHGMFLGCLSLGQSRGKAVAL